MQVIPEYEALDEFKTIAQKLISKYPDVFYGVPIDSVKAVVITNKERTEHNNNMFQIKAVPLPISLDCPFSHYVVIYQKDWEDMPEANRILLVSKVLCAIPRGADEEDAATSDARVLAPDLKDWNVMVRTFGPDYLVKEVPNILEKDIKFIVDGVEKENEVEEE